MKQKCVTDSDLSLLSFNPFLLSDVRCGIEEHEKESLLTELTISHYSDITDENNSKSSKIFKVRFCYFLSQSMHITNSKEPTYFYQKNEKKH